MLLILDIIYKEIIYFKYEKYRSKRNYKANTFKPTPASDGAGVKLKRSIGTPAINYLDPFLMLDEFGSENKDDYIGGFPPHPHRGIETVTYMLSGEV